MLQADARLGIFYKIIEHHLAVHFHFRKLSSWKWQKANKGWGLYEGFYVRDAILGNNFLFYREKRKLGMPKKFVLCIFSYSIWGLHLQMTKTNFAPAFIFTGLHSMECHRFIGGKLKVIIYFDLKKQINQHSNI